MKRFLRENLLIVLSVVLPLAVVLFFVLASVLPRFYVPVPSHELVLSAQMPGATRPSPLQVELIVSDQRLKLVVHKLDEGRTAEVQRVFIYEPVRDAVREIVIELPENIADMPDESELVVPGLSGLVVETSLRAPDGYLYVGPRRRSGMMMGLFGGHRPRNEVMIEKAGAVRPIRLPVVSCWYGEPRFIGWVVDVPE